MLYEVITDQAVALVEGIVFHPFDHLGEEGVGAGGDQQAQGAGAVDLEAAGHRVGGVVEGADGFQHVAGGLLADAAGVIEHMGDGGDRDSGPGRYVFNGCHRSSTLLPLQ